MAGMDELRSIISETHAEHPQRQWLALRAFDELKAALHALGQFGHKLALVEDEGPEPIEWPKMFYHANYGHLTVGSQEEADNLGPGWQDHPIGSELLEVPVEEPKEEIPVPKPMTVDIASFVAQGAKVLSDDPAKPDEKKLT